MKYFFEILLVILNLSYISYSQKFLLTNINSTDYSIDRISQQVYLKDFYTDTVRKVDLKNLEVNKTGRFGLLPFFGNKQHIMLYGNNIEFGDSNKNNLYLYNLDKQSYYLITDTIRFPPTNSEYLLSFSPNDINFMSFGKYYLSLEDSSLKLLDTNVIINYYVNDAYPQWSSDTSFVFLSIHNNVIEEYFLKSGRLDTLVIADTPILGFAYNVKHNILAYSTTNDTSEIYFHYKNSEKDTLIFSPFRDDPENAPCWDSGFRGITSLCWSPDNKKLAFLGFQFIDISAAGIYIYSLDSNRTYKATDCNDDGRKYSLKWVNNDTLIYSNSTDKFLYGIDVSSIITSVEQKKDSDVITDFKISNHPNPFNNSTKISITMPNNISGTFFIYDAVGRLVKKYHLDNKGQIKYEIIWDGLNDNNQSVSSGFYLGVLKSDLPEGLGNSNLKSTRIIKMIYLK